MEVQALTFPHSLLVLNLGSHAGYFPSRMPTSFLPLFCNSNSTHFSISNLKTSLAVDCCNDHSYSNLAASESELVTQVLHVTIDVKNVSSFRTGAHFSLSPFTFQYRLETSVTMNLFNQRSKFVYGFYISTYKMKLYAMKFVHLGVLFSEFRQPQSPVTI